MGGRHTRRKYCWYGWALLILWLSLSETLAQDQSAIECAAGWGATSTDKKVIPSGWINDGYCDCPVDGLDEPETEACSGSTDWPGVKSTDIDADAPPSLRYMCQVLNNEIPFSQLNDFICDCCDGADETSVDCPDECKEIAEKQRQARERMARSFQAGYEQRKAEIQQFAKLRQEKLQELSTFEDEKATILEELKSVDGILDELKLKYMESRMSLVSDKPLQAIQEILEPLSNQELITFMEYACQLAGEMDNAPDNGTCVPLRLAGLDRGLLWDDEDWEDTSKVSIHRVEASGKDYKDCADFFEWNTFHDTKVWSTQGLADADRDQRRSGGGRRRLMSDDDYYDRYDMDMSDDDIYDYDERGDDLDDDVDDYRRRRRQDRGSRRRRDDRQHGSEERNYVGEQKEVFELVEGTLFSKSRVRFLSKSKELIEFMESIEENVEENTEVEEGEDGEENKEEDDESDDEGDAAPPKDPMALSMFKSAFEERAKRIRQGYEYAMSARLLLGTLLIRSIKIFQGNTADYRAELLKLATATLYHGKIGAMHLWQILQALITELGGGQQDADGDDAQTCPSPWTSSCPPPTVERTLEDGRVVIMPTSMIIKAAQVLCDDKERQEELLSAACTVDLESSTIPDGSYGYLMVEPRSADDEVSQVFSEWDSVVPDPKVLELEDQREQLKNRRSDIDQRVQDTIDDIGGRDDTGKDEIGKYGPDGELHALKDSCHAIEAGKYVYEVCVFGKASQRDIGQEHGGTDLGSWKEMTMEDETGGRVMHWRGGAKCWNGPQRSATVFVRCGSESKILSADEPETCRYVFEMESHIACDETMKKQLGL